jgi:hypothetical protein
MEKKFKNKFAVTGSKHLVKAFAEELKELGYELLYQQDPGTLDCLIVNLNNKENKPSMGFGIKSNWPDYLHYGLPTNWDYCLELAKELEEAIPEYVKYIDTKYKGEVVKVIDWLSGSYCKVEHHKDGILQPFKHLVTPATKEEYEAQFKLFFGDKEVRIHKKSTGFKESVINVECAGEIGTLEQVQAIVDYLENGVVLSFGTKFLEQASDEKGWLIYNKSTSITESTIKIGCSYGTLAQLKKILEAGNKLK